jgi:hypothetical protein
MSKFRTGHVLDNFSSRCQPGVLALTALMPTSSLILRGWYTSAQLLVAGLTCEATDSC